MSAKKTAALYQHIFRQLPEKERAQLGASASEWLLPGHCSYLAADRDKDCVYLIERRSYKLRFVNKTARQWFPQAKLGARCYAAFFCKDAPCKNCPLAHPPANGEAIDRSACSHEARSFFFKPSAAAVKPYDGKEYALLRASDIAPCPANADEPERGAGIFTKDASLFHALCQSTDDYIFIYNPSRDLFYLSQNCADEFGFPGQVVRNGHDLWAARIHEQDRSGFLKTMDDLTGGKTGDFCQEYRARNKNGDWIWLRCRGRMEYNPGGKPAFVAGMMTNLGRKSKIDALSSLPNKYELETSVRYCLENHLDGELLILGLDNFKMINHLYGWKFGDRFLYAAAKKIQNLLPPRLQLCRLDGDKFGLLLSDADSLGAKEVYRIVGGAFQGGQQLGEHRCYCTVSGGCVRIGGDSASVHTLFRQAEYALEFSKENGKNCLTPYQKEQMRVKERTLILIERLRESADRDFKGFRLYFQPQVKALDCSIQNAEALLRWRCPEYGEVSPAEFIPLLEQTGLIHPVGRWTLRRAAMVCKKWQQYKPGFTMNVNLSYPQLLDTSFIPYLCKLLRSVGLDYSSLHLELTESCAASGNASLGQVFRKLQTLGFRIEMDDFGTGYSSLEILKNAPIDVVKIDRAFVKNITSSEFDAAFIRLVVGLCRTVGVKVCLEGVETWNEYRLVAEIGVDLIQGYLFGRPAPKKRFERLYLKNGRTAAAQRSLAATTWAASRPNRRPTDC